MINKIFALILLACSIQSNVFALEKLRFISIWSNHSDLQYQEGEQATFIMQVLTKPTNPSFHIELEASYPNSATLVPLEQIKETYTFTTPVLAGGSKVFTVKAYVVSSSSRLLIETATLNLNISTVIANVVINSYNDALFIGDQKNYSYTAYHPTGEPRTGTNVVWTSSNTSVATVDSSGSVSAIGQGTSNISVTVDGKASSPIQVSVSNYSTSLSLNLPQDFFLSKELTYLSGSYANVNQPVTVASESSTESAFPPASGKFTLPIYAQNDSANYVIKAADSTSAPVVVLNQTLRSFLGRGKYLFFNGTNHLAKIDFKNNFYSTGDSFGVSFWLRANTASTKILNLSTTHSGESLKFDIINGYPKFSINSSNVNLAALGSEIKSSEWTHFFITFNNVTHVLKLYQNGTLKSSLQNVDFSYPLNTNTGYLGLLNTAPFSIDELRFYKGVVSDQEASDELFNPKVNSDSKAFLFYSFDDNTSQVIGDDNERGSEITLGNSSTVEASDPEVATSRKEIIAQHLVYSNAYHLDATVENVNLDIDANTFVIDKNLKFSIFSDPLAQFTAGLNVCGSIYELYPYNSTINSAIHFNGVFNPACTVDTEDARILRINPATGAVTPIKIHSLDVTAGKFLAPLYMNGYLAFTGVKGTRPNISYSSPLMSESALTVEPLERALTFDVAQSTATINGSLDGANITQFRCNGQDAQTSGGFPLVTPQLNVGANSCFATFRKNITNGYYFSFQHKFTINRTN